MDDTAAGKAVLFQQMLHDLVVGVGVGTQALAVLHAPVQHGLAHALVLSGRCQTVHRAIGQGIVQPLAVLNGGVGGVRPQNKCKFVNEKCLKTLSFLCRMCYNNTRPCVRDRKLCAIGVQ